MLVCAWCAQGLTKSVIANAVAIKAEEGLASRKAHPICNMSLEEPNDDAPEYEESVGLRVPSINHHAGGIQRPQRQHAEVDATHVSSSKPDTTAAHANYVTKALSEALRTSEGERLVLVDQVRALESQLEEATSKSQEHQHGAAAQKGHLAKAPARQGLSIHNQVQALRTIANLVGRLGSAEVSHVDSVAASQQLHAAAADLQSDSWTAADAGQANQQIQLLLAQLSSLPAPPLPASPAHTDGKSTPPRRTRGSAYTASPQSVRQGQHSALPPTPASAVHHADVSSSTGARVLHEHIYSPDTRVAGPRHGSNRVRLWAHTPATTGDDADFGAGTPLPGRDGAPIPAFTYGKGKQPYPSRPSHPLHNGRHASGGSDRKTHHEAEDGHSSGYESEGGLLEELAAGEEGAAQEQGGASGPPSTAANASPFVPVTTTRRSSPQKRSKYAVGSK